MVRALLSAAVAAISLCACAHSSPPAASSSIVSADRANPSPLVKLDEFGYRAGGAATAFKPVVLPQIPQGADLVIRGHLTDASSDLNTARISVDGVGRVSTEPLQKGTGIELLVPASTLKPGTYAARVELVSASGPARAFEKPIAFEVDSPPAKVPSSAAKNAAPLRGSLDIIDDLAHQPPGHVETLALKHGGSLLIEGWAYDPPARSQGSAVLVVVDGKNAFQAENGLLRQDVVQHYGGDDTYRNVGFAAIIPASAFAAGSHKLDLMVFSKDGTHYYGLPAPFAFSVE